jgi:hypothetical protein
MSKELFRKIKSLIAVIVFIVAAGTRITANAQSVTVTGAITSDNYWALYYGTSTAITSYSGQWGRYGSPPNPIPITFTVPSLNDYVYIVAWSDLGTAQGFLASLQGQYSSSIVLTGYAPWEVKPTSLGLNGPPPSICGPGTGNSFPSCAFLSGLIGPLNGAISGSPPWTTPINNGSLNSAPLGSNMLGATKPWSYLTNIDPSAKWIWYKKPSSNSSSCLNATGSPFKPGCDHGEPLIFRVPASAFKPCLTVISDRTPCCIGRDSQSNPIYAFSATVKNPSSSTVPLTISGPAGTTILSYAPLSIPPGNSVVSGTFTVTGPVQTPFCLVFEITLPGFVDNSGEGPVETGRQSDGSAVQDAGARKPFPLPKVKCKGSLCFKQLPPC